MNVLFDYQCFVQRIGGVSRYHVELMRNFSNDIQWALPPLLSENVYLASIGVKTKYPLPQWRSGLKDNICKQINQWNSLYALRHTDYDVFHATGMNPYFVGHTAKPVVITVHDLIHEKYPDLMPKAEIVRYKRKKQLERADAIICISEETKGDLLKYHNVEESKISVIYHGIDQSIANRETNALFNFPYFLYVGSRSFYKNFARFAEAFARIDKDLHLVCTGGGFSKEETNLLQSLGILQRTHHLFASESQLENLFCHALAFVYPSRSEGFGLPILEAFRCGCPCIVSDIRCFHEVADDAAMYFDPSDTDSIYHSLHSALSDSHRLKILSERGLQRMKLFTWELSSRKHEELYRKLSH